MGDIADMMLEGILCEGCGGVVDGKASGWPRRCRSCELKPITLIDALARRLSPRAKQAARHNRERRAVAQSKRPFACDQCPRLLKTPEGLAQHKRDKHG